MHPATGTTIPPETQSQSFLSAAAECENGAEDFMYHVAATHIAPSVVQRA